MKGSGASGPWSSFLKKPVDTDHLYALVKDAISFFAIRQKAICFEGKSEEELLLITKPFHRGKGAAARHNGSGLGLAIARQIAQQHGGDLSVSQRAGGGLTVMVTLPLVEGEKRSVSG